MAQVLVRKLSVKTVSQLKVRARHNTRSLQAELKDILEREAQAQARLANFRLRAARWRRRLAGRRYTDSGLLQAEDRRR